MVIKLPPIKLIETYLHKEEQKARLVSMYELASSLLRKQEVAAKKAEGPKAGHALYPHLRPMYRTVHRTKPREMVLRAIRWVNPERMFPLMSWDKKKMDSLSREEFEAAFAELAKIRREAHVFANRYDQMINAIDAGQLPYHIPYANINYMSLAEHRERATRLGAGAEDWGHEIDVKAEEWRQQFESKKWEEGNLVIDNIDALWEDGAPPFMRTRGKAGRWKDERLMRARRQGVTRFEVKAKITDADGNDIDLDFQVHADNEAQAKRMVEASAKRAGRSNVQKVDITSITKLKKIKLPSKAKVWKREFVSVPEIERRPGEEVRIPKGNLAGQIRFPSAKPVWMSDEAWAKLLKNKKGQFGPKGSKVDLTSSPLDFYDTNIEVALRREQRWTQRGLAPHKGAASRVTGGHEAEEARAPVVTPVPRPVRPPAGETPEAKAKRQAEEKEAVARWEARRKQQEAAAKQAFEGEGAGHVKKPAAVLRNQRFDKALRDRDFDTFALIDTPEGFDPATHFAADNIHLEGRYEPHTLGGGHWNAGQTIKITDKNGQAWVLKVTGLGGKPVEAQRELVYQAIDRALGLNITPRVLLANKVDAKIWADTVITDTGKKQIFLDGFESGQGHINEFINTEAKVLSNATDTEVRESMSTPELRARWYSLALLDALSGNEDSWHANIMLHPEHGIFSIDNGLGFGGFATKHGGVFGGGSQFGHMFLPGAQQRVHKGDMRDGLLGDAGITLGWDEKEIETELSDFFDEYYDAAKIKDIAEATDTEPPSGGWDKLDATARKKEFVSKMVEHIFGK